MAMTTRRFTSCVPAGAASYLPLLLGMGLAACGSGTVNIGDGPSRRCPAARTDDPGPLAIVDAIINEEQTGFVTLTNDCLADRGDLVVSLSATGPGFSTVENEVVLAPGESADLGVIYVAAGYEAAEGTLVLATNDKDFPEVVIELQGVASPDQDGDGYEGSAVGGPDCDDFDAAVSPGAPETWYDGIDADCSGGSDFDQDGDGWDRAPEGADCDDLDDTVLPGAEELVDVRDNDCDGWVDEDALRPGDVLITEVMPDPVAVFDTSGEWFEVKNNSDRTLDLSYWKFQDLAGDEFTVNARLRVEPGQRLTFAVEQDYFLNGGVEPDYVYPRASFDLDNSTDTIAAVVNGNVVGLVEYDVRWPITAGAALQLDPLFEENGAASLGQYWCSAVDALNGGDLGTPGAPNAQCTSVDHDGDGITIDAGDCDDASAQVYPGAKEAWNGVDNNCDGLVDNATIVDIEAGFLDGDRSSNLGAPQGLSHGDLDGDGDLELMVATPRNGGIYNGVVYSLEASDASTWSDSVYNVDEAKFAPRHTYNAMGLISNVQADNDGDGLVDLVIGGSSGYTSTDDPAIMLFSGGSSLTGNLSDADADATWTNMRGAYAAIRFASHVDLNGDGAAELVYADPYAPGPGGVLYWGALYVVDADGATGAADLVDSTTASFGSSSYYSLLAGSIDGADLDGDGYDELIACARYADENAINAGSCYIIGGDKDDLESGRIDTAARATITGRVSNEQLGAGNQMAFGDFDDDGNVDLALGHPLRDEVRIFLSAGDLSGTYDTSDADLRVSVSKGPTAFGMGVAAGDFDGDGLDDLVVGAPDTMTYYGADEPGSLFVWTGSTLATASKTVDESDMWGAASGRTVGDALGFYLIGADLEADGVDDIVVAAPGYNTQAGRVSVVLLD